MPRYYFHTRNGERLETDEVGLELDDEEAAKDEARRAAGEMLRDGTIHPGEVLEVTDSEKKVVLRFSCTDVKEVG
jgi:hypothetical protein